jgi:hypothetical protein
MTSKEVTIFSMKKLLLLLAALIAFNAFADEADEIRALIPPSEGTVLVISNNGNLWRSVDSPSIFSAINRNPVFGIGATRAVTVLTDKALLYVDEKRIIKRIALDNVLDIQTSSFGLSKGLFIQTKDYDATLSGMNSDSQEAFVKALTAAGFKISSY